MEIWPWVSWKPVKEFTGLGVVRQDLSLEDLFGCCVEFGFCEGGREREEMNLEIGPGER